MEVKRCQRHRRAEDNSDNDGTEETKTDSEKTTGESEPKSPLGDEPVTDDKPAISPFGDKLPPGGITPGLVGTPSGEDKCDDKKNHNKKGCGDCDDKYHNGDECYRGGGGKEGHGHGDYCDHHDFHHHTHTHTSFSGQKGDVTVKINKV